MAFRRRAINYRFNLLDGLILGLVGAICLVAFWRGDIGPKQRVSPEDRIQQASRTPRPHVDATTLEERHQLMQRFLQAAPGSLGLLNEDPNAADVEVVNKHVTFYYLVEPPLEMSASEIQRATADRLCRNEAAREAYSAGMEGRYVLHDADYVVMDRFVINASTCGLD